ncbi:endolytic transglycosylase MltG [Modestobacter altitudinis]|uniref:endolytic transglycosylase MltG n=1 Tax=Modestobacter altitudinis TaxID=2213158 RepID=UPI00110D1441|nr:endolytic transglycosylase MltG [Modestobacter altitudinis]
MTDPTQPRPRGRHSQPDGDAGRPASELLAAWTSAGASTLQLADDTMRPRRGRRSAPDTDATGVQVLSPRGPVDIADVEITGLAAGGIADVGLAAAGLDLSAFGIDPTEGTRRPAGASGPKSWSWDDMTAASAAAETAPRTTEMLAVAPAVPKADTDQRPGRSPGSDRRSAPAPRAATEPTIADRVAADRFADAETDPGWLSANSRPVLDAPQPAGRGSLASLVTAEPRTAAPADEPATEMHPTDWDGDTGTWLAPASRHRGTEPDDGDDVGPQPDEHPYELAGPATVFDETGGLELVTDDDHHGPLDDHHDDADLDDHLLGGGGGRRGGRGGDGSDRPRKRRRPITIVLSLIVLAALVVGIGIGGKQLWSTINPVAEDYTGTGTGTVDVRVNDGDSLRAIAGTLVSAGVIASADPFEDAASANPAATGIQPGVYTLRSQMSGEAALDLLLDPASRQVTRVTLPEGLTVTQVLQRLADQTGIPLADLEAAAADPAALGLPAYANGLLEGFLFPATYDIEPGDTAVGILTDMVAGTVAVLDELQVPEDQRLGLVTEASIVQAEAGSTEDMGKVARVLDNRLADGMPLQLDTTVNYANGKSGITTTSEDRANPSPYNTYAHSGLPPGAISNPGQEALRAVLDPTPGDWRFFVVVDPDTGETRFAVTADEHQQNVLLFQQWLQDNPGN